MAKPRSGCGHSGYPEYMRDLIRILNKFSIKICLYLDSHDAKRRLAMTFWVSTQQFFFAMRGFLAIHKAILYEATLKIL
ncbi:MULTISPECIES: hypothetical protein [unclassified Rickettsia]|uniref:hypothetical protein n=1 Tax=unclassified Rickettsia TaxID=114295 RepID=UPI003132F046